MTGPQPRPGILDIAPYVGGKAGLAGRSDVARLASNESPLGPSPRAVAAYQKLAHDLHRYPDGGATKLRESLAKHYGIEAERIVCGAGSDEIIALLCRAYAGPGDEIVHTEHGFLMYGISARAVGATPVVAAETDRRADVDAILQAVGERSKLVFLANPNNPTGSYLDREEVARLHAGLPENVLLVMDAAYAEYVSRNDYTAGLELAAEAPNVVMTRTFSKIYGLSALRIGWAYGPAAVIDVLNRVRGPFNVSAPALAAAQAALEDVPFTDAARTHNDIWLPWFGDAVSALGLTVYPSVGNFVLIEFADEATADAANDHLNEAGIIPRKVGNYGLPACLRVSIGLEEDMRRTLAALEDFMAGRT